MTFKVGDKVRAYHHQNRKNIHPSQTWTIQRISGDWMTFKDNEYAHNIDNFHKVIEMNPDEIKEPTIINSKAKPKSTKKEIANKFFVYKVNGGGPKQLHNTYKDACNEANRLAELAPSHEFIVLGVLYSIKKVPQYITETKEFTL